MTKETFPASQLRTWKSPNADDVTTYSMLVNFKDLPDGISLKVNPRTPKMNTAVAKTLINAVVNTDLDFDIKNRGIIVTANSVKYDPNSKEVTIDFACEDDFKYLDLNPKDHHVVSVKSHVYLADNTLFQYTESRHQVDRFRYTEFARRQKR